MDTREAGILPSLALYLETTVMSWNQREINELRAKLLALTQEQKDTLTWEGAREYVPCDTICMAIWQGEDERRTRSPYLALCRVHCIE
jgi:hypothetical protein